MIQHILTRRQRLIKTSYALLWGALGIVTTFIWVVWSDVLQTSGDKNDWNSTLGDSSFFTQLEGAVAYVDAGDAGTLALHAREINLEVAFWDQLSWYDFLQKLYIEDVSLRHTPNARTLSDFSDTSGVLSSRYLLTIPAMRLLFGDKPVNLLEGISITAGKGAWRDQVSGFEISKGISVNLGTSASFASDNARVVVNSDGNFGSFSVNGNMALRTPNFRLAGDRFDVYNSGNWAFQGPIQLALSSLPNLK